MNPPFGIVVKVGGSLFERPDLPQLFHRWAADNSSVSLLLFAGGGELVETLRIQDQRFALGEEFCHAQALEMLTITAKILAKILNLPLIGWPLVTTCPRIAVFSPHVWLTQQEANPQVPWPQSWETTSDSLAAILAKQIEATELILLKSTAAETTAADSVEQWQTWAASGIVDPYFPTAAQGLRSVRIECPFPAIHEKRCD